MLTDRSMIRVLYRHPKWSEVQSFAARSRATSNAGAGRRRYHSVLRDQFILRASYDVLDGLCESVGAMTAAIADELTFCWSERTEEPGAFVQHAMQWPATAPGQTRASRFVGYADEPNFIVNPDAIMIHPMLARRWEAARIPDDRWHEWNS